MAEKRRGGGEGSIYLDGDYWVASIEAGRHPVTGQRLRHKVKDRTKAGALRKAAEARRQVGAGLGANTGATLLGDLLDWSLDTVVRNRVTSDLAMASYRGVVNQHLRRAWHYAGRQVDTRAGPPLSQGSGQRRTVRRMRMLLAGVLRHEERRGIVARSAASWP